MKKRFTVAVVWCLGLALNGHAMRGDHDANQHMIYKATQAQGQRPELSGQQQAALSAARREGVDAQVRPGWASRVSIRGKQLGRSRAFSGGRGMPYGGKNDHANNAVAVLDNLSPLIGVRHAGKEFKARRVTEDALGYHHVRMKQLHKGLRVVGGDLIVHFNEADEAYQVNGSYVPGIGVDTQPVLDPDAALQIALKDVASMKCGAGRPEAEPELVVYARRRAPALAYEVLLSSPADDNRAPGAWIYWVDAVTGEVIMRYNDIKDISAPSSNGSNASIHGAILVEEGGVIHTVTGWYDNIYTNYYLYNKDLKWYIYNESSDSAYTDADTYAHRSSGDWDDGGNSDRTEMSAAINLNATQAYFRNVHGRSSYDNANAYARANVHYGYNYNNAYWDPYLNAFYFGDGDGRWISGPLVVLDVMGHEFTHAVTDYTSDLVYLYESGALNESFSDIFGACIEFASQPDGSSSYPYVMDGYADWLLAEDCWHEARAMRDMRNPRNTSVVGAGNEQPSRYFGSYWYAGDGDNGGVHINSGVQNFFFYLLCDGDGLNGDNDGIAYNITGIGINNAEDLAYRALTVYCTPSTDYRDVRGAWIAAAEDLNPAWVPTVEAAWEACGVGPVDILPHAKVEFEGKEGGFFQPWQQVYTIVNESSTSVSWTSDALPPWLQASPAGGTLAAGASQEIQLTLTAAADSKEEGIYEASLTLSKTSGALIGSRQVLLRVGNVDFFSEQFDYFDLFDLDGLSLTFTPDSSVSGYTADAVPITALPIDPATHTPIYLSDDNYIPVALSDEKRVKLYDTWYAQFYIGSNGYITFGDGDNDRSGSFDAHFSMPRISMFFDDLDPRASGAAVKWQQLPDRAVVTFIDVPEYYWSYDINTFQTEMFFDGRIRLSWLGINSTDGLVGLSDGNGIPDYFRESDLSGFGWDYDGDGLPNWWEVEFFSGETNCIAGEDSDHDGQINMDEYVAGTNPMDDGSFFQADCSACDDGSNQYLVLLWDSIEGREYRIWKRDHLEFNTPVMIQSGITYPVNCYTATTDHAESSFYQVQVEMIE